MSEAADNKKTLDSFFVAAKQRGLKPQKAATPAAIGKMEKLLGAELPELVRRFFLRADGFVETEHSRFRLRGNYTMYDFLSLKGIAREWNVWHKLDAEGAFVDFEARMKKNKKRTVDARVQQKWVHEKWIPIAVDGSGNSLMLDLAPASSGVSGQIIQHWHDEDSRVVVANSFAELLATVQWGEDDEPQQKPSNEVNVKVWMFQLKELRGFCAKHQKKIAALPPEVLSFPCVLMVTRNKKRDTLDRAYGQVIELLPEHGSLSAEKTKRLFDLLHALEALLDECAPDYFWSDLGSSSPYTDLAFHLSADPATFKKAFEAIGARVDDTAHVLRWAGLDLEWIK